MIPDYWLKRPEFVLSKDDKEKLEQLWNSLHVNDIPWIENLPVPK
ncbi:MAG: hypothetical protein ACRCYY_21660 [Trueperaceae bacterium]